MLRCSQRAFRQSGVPFVQTTFDSDGPEWPYVEIEPKDDLAHPILIQRTGKRTWEIERMYPNKRGGGPVRRVCRYQDVNKAVLAAVRMIKQNDHANH
mgnify:FL=1